MKFKVGDKVKLSQYSIDMGTPQACDFTIGKIYSIVYINECGHMCLINDHGLKLSFGVEGLVLVSSVELQSKRAKEFMEYQL